MPREVKARISIGGFPIGRLSAIGARRIFPSIICIMGSSAGILLAKIYLDKENIRATIISESRSGSAPDSI